MTADDLDRFEEWLRDELHDAGCEIRALSPEDMAEVTVRRMREQNWRVVAPGETWRFELPDVPEHVTALVDRDGDVWLRHGRHKWTPAGWPNDSRPFADMLDFVPLVECEDLRGTR